MNETFATEGNGSIGSKRPQANILKAEEAKENNVSRRNGIAVPPLFMPERLCGIGVRSPIERKRMWQTGVTNAASSRPASSLVMAM